MTKSRLEAFSDGVFAIIITIMVLELKAPHETTLKALFELGPVFLGYICSFTFVGIYWVNHHHTMHTVHHVTSGIMWSNMGLLFMLSLLPFTTSWIGENHFANIPLAVYCVNLLLCAVAFYFFQLSIMKHYTHSTKLIEALKKQEKKGIISLIIYIVSIPAALYEPILSGVLILITAVWWIIPDKNIERALKD